MKEQKVIMTNDQHEINGYIDKGWIIANMIPMTVNTGNRSYDTGKVCFLLEREQ